MRKITEHIVSGDQAHQLTIEVTDEPVAGGANHRYEISGFDTRMNPSEYEGSAQLRTDIIFQNGPIKEAGVNGITQEALLAIVLDRLRGFQNGAYPSDENAEAIEGCTKALHALQRRTMARIARGVEGTTAA